MPPAKPECSRSKKYYISGTVKKVNFCANNISTQRLSQQETVQWPCPLIDQLSGLLRKIELFMGCSVFKYAKKCIGGWGSTPDPTEGAHNAPPVPDLLVGWGGGHQSQCPSILAPSALQSSWPPWKPVAPADLELATVLSGWHQR